MDGEFIHAITKAALSGEVCHRCGHAWHSDSCVNVAPAVEPAQAVPEGYRLQSIAELDAMNEWIYSNDDLTIAYMSGRNDQKAVDHYNKQKALDFVRWIAQLKTGGLIQARANDILRILEKWK